MNTEQFFSSSIATRQTHITHLLCERVKAFFTKWSFTVNTDYHLTTSGAFTYGAYFNTGIQTQLLSCTFIYAAPSTVIQTIHSVQSAVPYRNTCTRVVFNVILLLKYPVFIIKTSNVEKKKTTETHITSHSLSLLCLSL